MWNFFFLFFFFFLFARHAWLLSSGCGVYHGHVGSSSSRLLRLSLGASKRAAATSSSGGLLGRNSQHHLIASSHCPSGEVVPSSSSSSPPATTSYCDLKNKRKIRDKAIKTSRSTPSGPCPVMPRDPMTDGPVGKNPRAINSRRPLTRSVLRASLSPLAGTGSPSGSGVSKKILNHHGSPSIKTPGIVHPRRLLPSHVPLPKWKEKENVSLSHHMFLRAF